MTTRRRSQSAPATDRATQATPLLTDKQVMASLKVSRTGLHYLMRKDGLPYIKLGEGRCAALQFHPSSLPCCLAGTECTPAHGLASTQEEKGYTMAASTTPSTVIQELEAFCPGCP